MRKAFLLLLYVLALRSAAASAAGFYVPDVGVRALGRGGAFVARADDGTAAWYNPAGFADQRGTRLFFETAFTKQSVNLQRFDAQGAPLGFPVGNSAAPKFIPFLGVSSDFGLRNFTFALSLYGPYAKNTDFPDTGEQRYSLISARATEAFYQVSAAWRALPWLRVGAAFRGVYFNAFQRVAVAISDTCDPQCGPQGSTDVRTTYDVTDKFAANWIVGALVSPVRFLDFGVSFRPKTPVGANGSLTVDQRDVERLRRDIFPSIGIQGDQIEVSLEMPLMVRAGVRFKQPRFDVEADFVFERWDGFGRLEIRPHDVFYTITSPTPRPLPVIIQERNYGDAWSVRVGSDIEVLPGTLTARLGYFYETSAVALPYLTVSLVDSDKHGFGIGLTARFRWFAFSVAYSHVELAERTVLGSLSRQINLTYIALDQQNQAPPVGNGRYRAGWDNVSFGISFDLDLLAGRTRQ